MYANYRLCYYHVFLLRAWFIHLDWKMNSSASRPFGIIWYKALQSGQVAKQEYAVCILLTLWAKLFWVLKFKQCFISAFCLSVLFRAANV